MGWVATLTSISNFSMHQQWDEEWEEFSDDWFDNADQIVFEGHCLYLEKCLQLPSAQRE